MFEHEVHPYDLKVLLENEESQKSMIEQSGVLDKLLPLWKLPLIAYFPREEKKWGDTINNVYERGKRRRRENLLRRALNHRSLKSHLITAARPPGFLNKGFFPPDGKPFLRQRCRWLGERIDGGTRRAGVTQP